jgi:alpha-galactosidase
MPKTVVLGAGSWFGISLCVDLLSHEALREGEFALMDINAERAEYVATYATRAAAQIGCGIRISHTTDRREALAGADFVVTSFHIGGPAYSGKPYYYDIEIPNKYGVYQQIGDTIGPGGVARFLRTMPVYADMLRDAEELAPHAYALNYVNPMSMLMWAARDCTSLPAIGLCHSVQGGSRELARLAGVPPEEFRYTCAGINHMGWFTECTRGHEDLYPRIKAAARADAEFLAKNRTRCELMFQFGAYPAEGPSHHSEYYPYFRKSEQAQTHYGLGGAKSVDPEGAGYHDRRWQSEDMQAKLKGEKPIDLSPSHEYASTIMNSIVTGRTSRIHGNVPNAGGLIENLPLDCIVEVPCLVDENGWHGCSSGTLPSQLAALNIAHINVHRLAVEAWKEHSREKAIHAMMLDPLTAAVCTMDEARAMANELLDSQPEHLGYLK